MTKYLPFVLYLWLIAFHEIILKDMTSILGVTINLPILILLMVAVYKSEMTSVWFGFFVGLTAFAGSGFTLGYQVFIFCAFGFMAYHIREKMNLDSLYARLLLIVAGVFLHNLILMLMVAADNFIYEFFTSVLPGALYTTVVAWLFFMIKEERITYKKFKSIF